MDQELTDVQIQRAITAGQEAKQLKLPGAYAWGRVGGRFEVRLLGPLNRITLEAFKAKQKYDTFTPGQVTAEMRAPIVIVTADPLPPRMVGGSWQGTAPATYFVLKTVPPKKGIEPVVLKPTEVRVFPRQWATAIGGTLEGRGVHADFPLSSLRGLPAGELQLVVVTDVGEWIGKINIRTRSLIE